MINGRKELGRSSTNINMKQSRFEVKYGWINGRNKVGRRRKARWGGVDLGLSVWSE